MQTNTKAVFVRRGLIWSHGADMQIVTVAVDDIEGLTRGEEDDGVLGDLYPEELQVVSDPHEILNLAAQIRLKWFKWYVEEGDPDADHQIRLNTINSIPLVDKANVLNGLENTLYTPHEDVYGPEYKFEVAEYFHGEYGSGADELVFKIQMAMLGLPRSVRDAIAYDMAELKALEDKLKSEAFLAQLSFGQGNLLTPQD